MDAGDALKQTVVLCPGIGGAGHVGPMAHLAELFPAHGYDATVVLIEPPIRSSDSDASFIGRIAAAHPSVSFHVLPPLPPPDFAGSDEHPFLLVLRLLQRYNERLEAFLRSIVSPARLHSLVVDQFYVQAIDVAAALGGVPVYTFVSSGASALAVFIQIPALLAGRKTGLKELGDTPLDLAGVPPMPTSHIVKDLLEHPEDDMCRAMVDILKRGVEQTHGVLVNTFESLERRAVHALRDPLSISLPGGGVLPPIYCVGPLVGNGDDEGARDRGEDRAESLAWLDAQPERSVVFLCFGSMGALPEEQLREIAGGLEASGQRFLWVVRTPPGRADLKKILEQRGEPDLDALLPEGFLERTRGRGLVVRSWAPQAAVLHHPATAAFVTHCGWNSALEGVAAGVPMLCWPLYAEQMMNKVFMTTGDMGVGVGMEGYAAGLVGAGEVEAKVRQVMDDEQGRELRARVAARRYEAEEALRLGGSSQRAFAQFLSDAENAREHLGK
jgi:UDP-N-acetylglucosamine:LPS N-acetylglucosamine transferase